MKTSEEPTTPSNRKAISIAEFCRERRLPQRRILRLVKGAVIDHLGEEEAESSWRADLSEEMGLVARRREGSARITYEVVAPEVLSAWCAELLGADLLTREELEHIADAARSYYRLAMDEHEKHIIMSRNKIDRFQPNERYFAPLDEALRRMGK